MRRLRSSAARLYWEGPDGPGNVLVRASTGPYRDFDRRIDRQLARLVDRWARPGAPSYERPESLAVEPKVG